MATLQRSDVGALLVVGGRPETVRKAAEMGIDVVLLQHRDHFAAETVEWAKAVIVADYTDWAMVEPLVAAAHKAYGFTAALSLTEPGLDPVGRITEMLGLGGNPWRVTKLLRDKLELRRHLARLGGAAARISVAAAAVDDEESLHAFGREHGYPFIVKPVDLAGSVGVHKVESAAQVPEVWRAVRELSVEDPQWRNLFTAGGHLVEEYLDGPEYSVEAFSFEGRHVVVGITEKLVDPTAFVELGHAQPARLDAAARQAVESCVHTLLDAVGLRHGASHTELRLTPDGPKVVEGHNRIGGDRIVDLLELTYGLDFEAMMVGLPFGLVTPLDEAPPPRGAAATRFITAPAGTVTEVSGADQVREQPGVVAVDVAAAAGTVIRPGSNFGRAGQVLVTADDVETAVARCAELAGRIEVRVAAE